MISEETIRNWARLVSESVGSEEKFVVGDVFPEESVSEIEKDPEKFWEFSRKVKDELEYDVQDEIDELDDVEFETSDHPNSPYTTTHRLKVTDCYGGWDGCFAEFPKWFFRTYSPEDRISFGEAVERFGEWLYENAG